MLSKLLQFIMYPDTWFLSQAITYGIFVAIFGGIAWLSHPPDIDETKVFLGQMMVHGKTSALSAREFSRNSSLIAYGKRF